MGRVRHDRAMSGPLEGLRVIDASSVIAGPLSAQILGDYGADVIKIEHPKIGDSLRSMGARKGDVGLWWKLMGRNKRTVGLYLGDPEGAKIFEKMVATADVVIQNFRPGTFERWGLGFDRLSEINPGLVLMSISGFGPDGPYRDRPGFGTLAESMSSFAAMTGPADGPPTLPPLGLADTMAGMTTVSGILMALRHRDQTGEGQEVSINLVEPIMLSLGPIPISYDQLGEVPERLGNRSRNTAPRNTYLCSDDTWVALSSASTATAARAMTLVGHAEVIDEPWFETGVGRAENAELLDGYVQAWVGARTRDQVLEECRKAEVVMGAIYDIADLFADPQVEAMEMLTDVEDEDLGTVRMQNLMLHFSASPGAIRFTGRPLGADTEDILVGELGVSRDELADLRERGIAK